MYVVRVVLDVSSFSPPLPLPLFPVTLEIDKPLKIAIGPQLRRV
jgi:hypothetical protein